MSFKILGTPVMSVIFNNSTTGERIESDNEKTCGEILKLLRQLKSPDSTLITKLPSGMGLDFNLQKDGSLWVEFYADELSSAFVTFPIAEKIVERAFQGANRNVKSSYADLISKWEY